MYFPLLLGLAKQSSGRLETNFAIDGSSSAKVIHQQPFQHALGAPIALTFNQRQQQALCFSAGNIRYSDNVFTGELKIGLPTSHMCSVACLTYE
jgi:hypothetical protein